MTCDMGLDVGFTTKGATGGRQGRGSVGFPSAKEGAVAEMATAGRGVVPPAGRAQKAGRSGSNFHAGSMRRSNPGSGPPPCWSQKADLNGFR